ncbi:MAG: undecaprenyl-diphosphatase UppP [Elusimicrobia bacterium]|nr:undecaprenyl-diphosphatase UppP [Candidatus Liberimonas magnetica]
MEVIQAVVLGLVQGFTEFLPVSSSGHLIVIPWIFKWNDLGATFDVALHLGTLISLVFYFWRDWIEIIRRWKEPFLWLIAVGCVPAAVFGYKFEKTFETVFRSPLLVAVFMISMGLLMWLAELRGKKNKDMESLNLGDTLFIGFAQVLALMPGVSRSGITITAGIFSGFKRESAARFSFLLAMPITFGAGLLKLKHVMEFGIPKDEYRVFLSGILFATISGFLAIKYLLKFLQKHSLYVFIWYRMIVGLAVLLIYFLS